MSPDPRRCSIANALALVGEKWALLAIREAFFGVHRFDEIAHNTGASRDILAARLRTLVEHGILEKRLYSERPPRYEYHLTRAGRELHPVLLTLMAWGDKHVTEGPAPVTWEHSCGAAFQPRLCCASCGEPVRADRGELTVRDPGAAARPSAGAR